MFEELFKTFLESVKTHPEWLIPMTSIFGGGIFLGWQLRHWIKREAEHNSALVDQVSRLQKQLDQTSNESRGWKAKNKTNSVELRKVKAEQEPLERKAVESDRRMKAILDANGRIWESPVILPPPLFRPRFERKSVVIAVLNLKGGVGKTTLTANLGATFAASQENVLLVDLDHQHSLSDVCLEGDERENLRKGGRFIDNIFEPGVDSSRFFDECIMPVPGMKHLDLVPADERLADVEMKAMAHWMVDPTGQDARYLLRSVLHSPKVDQRYDWTLLDCPPRLTTATINALCVADYVLIPVLLDSVSASAPPRLLKWLRTLKHSTCICPNLSLLGIVGNKCQTTGRLSAKEEDVSQFLKLSCQQVWPDDVKVFNTCLPRRQEFADGPRADKSGPNRFAARYKTLQPTFNQLMEEIKQRIPGHANSPVV